MIVIYYFVLVLFLLLSVVLCFVILMQESKSSGLGASFGGDSGESLFGTSTADVLKKFTAWLSVIFMIGCIVLSLWTNSLSRSKVSSSAPKTELIEK